MQQTYLYHSHYFCLLLSIVIVEVVTRLLDNAYRFTPPEGEVTVNIWIMDQGAQILPSGYFGNESTLKICVSDTGKGIATEELANISR